jgi:hypothetical protein
MGEVRKHEAAARLGASGTVYGHRRWAEERGRWVSQGEAGAVGTCAHRQACQPGRAGCLLPGGRGPCAHAALVLGTGVFGGSLSPAVWSLWCLRTLHRLRSLYPSPPWGYRKFAFVPLRV